MSLVALSHIWTEPRDSSHPIALCDGKTILFAQFRSDVMRIVPHLKNTKRVLLLCADSYHFLVGMYALLQTNAVIVLPANNQPSLLEKLEYDCCVDDEFISKPTHETAILSGLDPLRLCFEFFTSGSSGQPKIIRKNLQMLENEITCLNAALKLRQGPIFATVAHQHLYGLMFKLLWPLASGRMFSTSTYSFWETLMPVLTPEAVIITSPAHLTRLGGINSLYPSQYPIQIFSAGSVLPLDASKQSEGVFGCLPSEIFGSTETGAIASRQGGGLWQPLPGITISTNDNNVMLVRSPAIGEDIFITDDRIELQAKGFRFLGRADRIGKIEGKRISFIEVEHALLTLNEVESAIVFTLSGDSPKLVSVVILTPEGKALLAKKGKFRFCSGLRQVLASVLEPMAIPRMWRFVDAIPTHAMGKVNRAELLKLFEEAV